MKKIKWVKKIERISDSGDVKESIYKPEKGKGGISIVTVKKAIRSCRKDDELTMRMTTKEYLETANKEMGRKVWEHYGEETQTKKFVEELSELITALARDDIRAVREEMADVEVMIMQFKQGLDIDTLPIMNYKLNRTMARIENEKSK